MKAFYAAAGAACAALSLGACSTMGGGAGPTDVTRFHLNQQVAKGPIAIEPSNPAMAGSLSFSAPQAAVARQLTRLGWTVVPGNARTEQVAMIDFTQGEGVAQARRSPFSIGIGGGTGGYSSGVGVGASVGIGGGRRGQAVASELRVGLKRRSEGTVFWEGRAQTQASAGNPAADPAGAAEKLADALFRDFPGESGRTIRVK